MNKDFIKKYIYDNLESVDECIIDGEGCNFEISIISNQFLDMTMLQRHKLVMAIFEPFLRSGELHALSLKLKTNQEI